MSKIGLQPRVDYGLDKIRWDIVILDRAVPVSWRIDQNLAQLVKMGRIELSLHTIGSKSWKERQQMIYLLAL